MAKPKSRLGADHTTDPGIGAKSSLRGVYEDVSEAYQQLEALLLTKRIMIEDYGGVGATARLLAEELDVQLPLTFEEAVRVRHAITHPALGRPTLEAAVTALLCLREAIRLLAELDDGPVLPPSMLEGIRAELRSGFNKRTLDARTHWEQYHEAHPVLTIVEGRVWKLRETSALIRLSPGVLGLLHLEDISHVPRRRAEESLREGQTIHVLRSTLKVRIASW